MLPNCRPLQYLAGCARLPATTIPSHSMCLSHPGKTHGGPSLPHQHDLHLHLPITHRLVCRHHRAGKMTAKVLHWGAIKVPLVLPFRSLALAFVGTFSVLGGIYDHFEFLALHHTSCLCITRLLNCHHTFPRGSH